ncbi:MAG: STAS domain-containing protein [Phycisphaeraceae bacterium JB051]
MQMEILDAGGNVTHVKLLGSMDANGAYENIMRFENVVTSAREHALVDMSGLSFISSIGMSAFVESAKALRRTAHKLVLYALQPNVKTALQTAGLDKLMVLADDMQQAQDVLA